MEYVPSKVISLILILLVIVLLVFGFSKLVWPGVKTALGWDIGENLTVSNSTAIKMYKNFLLEYKACKETADTDCICQITTFTLPKVYAIALAKEGSNTRINLFYKNDLLSKEENDKSDNLIANDELNFPGSTPGQSGDYFDSNTADTFDISDFIPVTSINLYQGGTTLSTSGIKMTGFQGEHAIDSYGLYGFYKLVYATYFIPSPHQIMGSGSEACLAKSLSLNFRQCSRISTKSKPEIDKVLSDIKQKMNDCKERNKEAATNVMCNEKFQIAIPESLSFIISGDDLKVIKASAAQQETSYPVELSSGMLTIPNLNYLFVNGHWMWKENAMLGIIPSCSCRYYPININDPTIECSASSLNNWFKGVNAQLAEAESYEDSYNAGLAVLIKSIFDHPGSSEAKLIVRSPSETTFTTNDFGIDIEENVKKLKKETTRVEAVDNLILLDYKLPAALCKLNSISPITKSEEQEFQLNSGNHWMELAFMSDSNLCFTEYSQQQIEDMARRAELNKVFGQTQ